MTDQTQAPDEGEGPEPIAIVSMAARFPGALDADRFWANTRDGVESITHTRPGDLLLADHDPEHVLHPGFVGAEGLFPEDPALFDAGFFGYSPREAAVMDPQHRVCLELAWEAFDRIGLDPSRQAGATGVFLSAGLSTYLVRNLMSGDRARQRRIQQRDGMHLLLHNDKDFAATTVSFKLGLTGPSMAVGSACSSSLVAVHLACRSLQDYECDQALAGGVYLQIPSGNGYIHTDDGVYSPDGRCAPFDASASGTVGGSGAGLVLLKRLSDAQAAGDRIHALIIGSAVNNDGSDKVGYTAPSAAGQKAAIIEAHAVAGITADTIGYVEAHGTATRLGDPIEADALTGAFRATTERTGFCALGSAKANIGHLDAAAGIAGLIKAASVVRDGVIPPTLHFREPNPDIDLDRSPFYVPVHTADWRPEHGPRRAGVSSFGIGGTNAHLVLEQPPEPGSSAVVGKQPPESLSDAAAAEQVLVLSAASPEALASSSREVAARPRAEPAPDLADVAATLAGRRVLPYRRAVSVADIAGAAALLERRPADLPPVRADRNAVFVFSGQGDLDLDRVARLAQADPAFGRVLDECAGHLAAVGFDLRSRTASGVPAQPVLVAVQYALAKALMASGVAPAAVVGHSLGEYTAAVVAGVLELPDALALTAAREELCADLPPGRMVAVSASAADLADRLPPGVELAAVNAPDRCVVSGPAELVDAFAAELAEQGIARRMLPVRAAFHTAAVEPIRERFAKVLAGVGFGRPAIRFASATTGQWVGSAQVVDPGYWLEHMRRTVRFGEALGHCLELGPSVVVEIGPDQGTEQLARRVADALPDGPAGPYHTVRCLPRQAATDTDTATDADAAGRGWPAPVLARLWELGCAVDWTAIREAAGHPEPRRVALPSGRLDRRRHWIGPPPLPADFSPLAELTAELRETAAAAPAGPGIDDHPGLRAGLDKLCAAVSLRYFVRGGIGLSLGAEHQIADVVRALQVRPAYVRMIDTLIDALAADGLVRRTGEVFTVVREPLPEELADSAVPQLAARLTRDFPGFAGLVELVVHCAEAYPEALSRPGAALGVLYPDGSSDLLVRTLGEQTVNHRSIDALTALAGTLLDRLATELDRPVRVLEVGAGEGNLTRVLAGRPDADRLVYHATDISSAFATRLAAQARQRGMDWVRTSVLDIRRDPAEQGFAGHRYDLICGLDVVHATPDVRHSITQLRSLLAPGGLLALVETTAADRWLSLIWGLTEDWWTYTDTRSAGPLLAAEEWHRLMAGLDFAASDVVLPSGPQDSALILAQETAGEERTTRTRVSASAAADEPAWPEKRSDLSTWCYRPGWRSLPPVQPEPAPESGNCLLLGSGPLAAAVAQRISALGLRVVEVARIEDLAESAAARTPVRLVVHLWPLENVSASGPVDLQHSQDSGLHALLDVARSLGEAESRDPVRLVSVTCGAQEVLGGDTEHPEYATVSSAVKVIPREYPWISCAAVDLASGTQDPEELADLVTAELLGARESAIVAYRGRRRFGPSFAADRLAPAPAPASAPAPAPAPASGTGIQPEPGGVYLICGGLGGVGLSIAECLGRVPVRLILTGRRAFPAAADWDSWPDTGDATSRTIARLRALSAAGCDIRTERVDVADAAGMAEVVRRTEQELGPLRGVVNAAGVLDTAGMIQRRGKAETDAAIRSKTAGNRVLHDAVADRPLDFFVMCSSIGAALYKLKFGEVGYVAGNDFVNAFAEYRAARSPGLTLAVAWSDWLEDGMWAAAQERLAGRYAVAGGAAMAGADPNEDILGGITRAEGQEVFARLLAARVSPRALISTQDFDALLARHDAFSTGDHLAAVSRLSVSQDAGPQRASGPSSPSSEDREAPADPVQRRVAEHASTLLGLPMMAADDDFFALGGDSLLALRLLAGLREEYGVEIPIARIFESPTVAGIAEALLRIRDTGHQDWPNDHEEVVL
ncbi:acyl transferase domain-containing protein/2-polyprenyl-3-methyl-5-hydroxy-6-metoxy-1,4-benzoquinol methylase/acyl carrier protein [Catenulispora sp. MAP12-49]|uniref:type I polyketide synthase n=1 Tax=Catenulispora sp. MAP12-49 TaxID=3156302 RepID=UPI00351477B9